MLGKALYYGKDWDDEDHVKVYEPSDGYLFWVIFIDFKDGERIKIKCNEAVVVYENDKIVEIHY